MSGAVVSPPAEEVRLPAPRAAGALRERLAGIVGAAQVRDDDAMRALRAAGKSYLDLLVLRSGAVEEAPDLVVAPGGHEEVQAVLEACAEAGAAVIPFGGGTSVVGGVAPVRGEHALAVCLDLARASLYFTVLARQDADPAAQWLAAKAAASDAIAAAGATITHHHAVGRDHARWAAAEHGVLGTGLLRAAKRACDPAGIMNPGKLLAG